MVESDKDRGSTPLTSTIFKSLKINVLRLFLHIFLGFSGFLLSAFWASNSFRRRLPKLRRGRP